eukprot:CAMPEP_0194757566 /NCGR_PEP_ID=MMETSP0323_2-20130528/11042_1 /TAXON_ID=2866 ORGANISM="Crypthecodinium cohnii, Strain Seligo" /NCGR_SAMPLE_ID=MMETSP0323_2 /ASSEMBLY_ACC=CAM_ASM_000346 /LENGTH=64 /DNA_ID=CAMNT_0039677563 /DNA_START=544 /DNA_END=734 /DNA_ORIENTATION=-
MDVFFTTTLGADLNDSMYIEVQAAHREVCCQEDTSYGWSAPTKEGRSSSSLLWGQIAMQGVDAL